MLGETLDAYLAALLVGVLPFLSIAETVNRDLVLGSFRRQDQFTTLGSLATGINNMIGTVGVYLFATLCFMISESLYKFITRLGSILCIAMLFLDAFGTFNYKLPEQLSTPAQPEKKSQDTLIKAFKDFFAKTLTPFIFGRGACCMLWALGLDLLSVEPFRIISLLIFGFLGSQLYVSFIIIAAEKMNWILTKTNADLLVKSLALVLLVIASLSAFAVFSKLFS